MNQLMPKDTYCVYFESDRMMEIKEKIEIEENMVNC